MIRLRLLIPYLFCSVVAVQLARTAPPPNTLEPVRLSAIQLGGFWKQQAKRLTERWLPHCIRQMEAGGQGQELVNLIALGQRQQGHDPDWEYTGLPWSDAYVYNTVEAICLALAVNPEGDADLAQAQAHLRAKLEAWIPIVLAAQAPDGYIHSFHALNQHPRYSNIGWHEFYVMGYFLEMGVAHYRMVEGKDRRLYDAAVKCADHLAATFGPAPKRTWRNGHAGLEYALARLGRLVNEVEGDGQGDPYVNLSRYFLDHQHEGDGATPYNQSEQPAIKMSDATGHAVRATYFYTAMTDIALLQGSPVYEHAVDRLWNNAIQKKHYLTGGVGASHQGEAFDADYRLPNDGYCESCAGCGLSFWADRMHRLHRHGHYRDVQERALYNNILGAIELSGENFFYQNPLDSGGSRYPWHGCPCCVGNIPRALLAIKDLIYSTNAGRNELFLSHYVDSQATLPNVGGASLTIQQQTDYPWNGVITITLRPESPTEFALRLRIPDRTESELYSAVPDTTGMFTLRLNGTKQSATIQRGYVTLHRNWKQGDRVELTLPIPAQRVFCDQQVQANRGRVALQRGPLVYNVEDVDHQVLAADLVLQRNQELSHAWRDDLFDGVMLVQAGGIVAVPNYARLNRGGASQVWIVEDPAKVVANLPQPPRDLPGFTGVEQRTIDNVAIGHRPSERQHALQGERTSSGRAFGHHWRHAVDGGSFSYRLKVNGTGLQNLFCTYWGSDGGNRRFTLRVDGQEVGSQVLNSVRPGKFFGVEYPIPADLTQDKDAVTVQLRAEPGATAGGIFDLRTVTAP